MPDTRNIKPDRWGHPMLPGFLVPRQWIRPRSQENTYPSLATRPRAIREVFCRATTASRETDCCLIQFWKTFGRKTSLSRKFRMTETIRMADRFSVTPAICGDGPIAVQASTGTIALLFPVEHRIR